MVSKSDEIMQPLGKGKEKGPPRLGGPQNNIRRRALYLLD